MKCLYFHILHGLIVQDYTIAPRFPCPESFIAHCVNKHNNFEIRLERAEKFWGPVYIKNAIKDGIVIALYDHRHRCVESVDINDPNSFATADKIMSTFLEVLAKKAKALQKIRPLLLRSHARALLSTRAADQSLHEKVIHG